MTQPLLLVMNEECTERENRCNVIFKNSLKWRKRDVTLTVFILIFIVKEGAKYQNKLILEMVTRKKRKMSINYYF